MMHPESLVKLVGSGNSQTVEEEWLQAMESAEATLPKLAEYSAVLKELCQRGRPGQAESLAWAAIETLSTRHGPLEALTAAGPFLLAIGDSPELRKQVTALYRSAYEDRDGLDELLAEAGIEGGRPVRRALRTLGVCLALREGDFLVTREDDGAARVNEIDRPAWEFTLDVEEDTVTLGAVHLADQYERSSPTDYRVQLHFEREDLIARLKKDPASVLGELCRRQDDKITGDQLESLLVPDLISPDKWKSWWTRIRATLKRHPNFELTGRSPYLVTFHSEAQPLEDRFLEEFGQQGDPLARWTSVEKYFRDCKTRKQAPSNAVLRQCYDDLCKQAEKLPADGSSRTHLQWVIAARIGELGEIEGAMDGAVRSLKSSPDQIPAVFTAIESDLLMDVACRCMAAARPDDWDEQMLSLLPSLPAGSCDRVAIRLIEAGRTRTDFEPVIQQILASPIKHFEALLWLWGGPSKQAEIVFDVAPITILMRILRTLDDARRSETIDKERTKQISARARSVLSARKYQRFASCLEKLEPGMAAALRTQLSRADALGRAVREDMLRVLTAKFPTQEAEEIAPWAREDVIYVINAALQRKQAEIEEHVNVKMKENARAIGRAAEHGDLSENSEYKFALEERDLLRARLAQMNDELAMAKLMTPEDVPTDHIGIGTKALFERLNDGHRTEMSFVDPWGTDADRGLFNYKAPLAQRLMGKCVGDVVKFSVAGVEGEYKIVDLLNALS